MTVCRTNGSACSGLCAIGRSRWQARQARQGFDRDGKRLMISSALWLILTWVRRQSCQSLEYTAPWGDDHPGILQYDSICVRSWRCMTGVVTRSSSPISSSMLSERPGLTTTARVGKTIGRRRVASPDCASCSSREHRDKESRCGICPNSMHLTDNLPCSAPFGRLGLHQAYQLTTNLLSGNNGMDGFQEHMPRR
jgi:hypothetical protein